MKQDQISENTKLEIALEILSTKIAITSKEGYSVKNKNMQVLLKDRQEMYLGNKEVIEKIINEYGPEVKQKYEGINQ